MTGGATGLPENGLYYLDSSALVKLAVREAETAALRRFLRPRPGRVTSALAVVEVLRTVRRRTAHARVLRAARRVLDGVTQLALADELLESAALMEPLGLRSLDAIHLAAALSLGRDLASLITYDDRLADAARQVGVPVSEPR